MSSFSFVTRPYDRPLRILVAVFFSYKESLMPFLDHCQFSSHLWKHVGVEREYILTNHAGHPVPRSADFLTAAAQVADIGDWGYELSACQIENRTAPISSRAELIEALRRPLLHARCLAESLSMHVTVQEVAPADMTLEVFPLERYQAIRARLPLSVLSAACRVTGTHVHLGVRNIEEALEVHNRLVRELPSLIRLGDHSDGERLRLYRTVAPDCDPPIFENLAHLEKVAAAKGFANNPRDCWHLVRISRHGTVEVRVFGMTDDIAETCEYAAACHEIAFGSSLRA